MIRIKPVLKTMILGLLFSGAGAIATPVKTVKKVETLKTESTPDLILEVDGKIFPQDSFPDACKDLFHGAKCEAQSFGHCHIESKKDNDVIYSTSSFKGPDGEQQLEQSWEKDGKVQKCIIENKVLGQLMELNVKDGKTFYSYTDTKTHKVKTSDEDSASNLVVPSTIISYIRPRFAQIMKGEKVQVRIAVMDHLESFTFNIKKIRDEKALDGDPVAVLEMVPASFIVKAVVSPMYFYIRTKTGEVFAFEGESAVRRKVADSWKKMQVFTQYDYKVNADHSKNSKNECDPTEMLLGKKVPKCEINKE